MKRRPAHNPLTADEGNGTGDADGGTAFLLAFRPTLSSSSRTTSSLDLEPLLITNDTQRSEKEREADGAANDEVHRGDDVALKCAAGPAGGEKADGGDDGGDALLHDVLRFSSAFR